MDSNATPRNLTGTELAGDEKPFAVPSVLPTDKAEPNRLPTGTVIRVCLVVLGVALLAYFVYRLLPVLLLLLIAIMFATAIEPVVTKLRRGPFSRSQGVLIVYTGIFLVLVVLAWLIVPLFISQAGEVLGRVTDFLQHPQSWENKIPDGLLRSRAVGAADALKSLLPSASTPATGTPAEQAAGYASTLLGLAEGALSVILLFVIAFYWMTERTLVKRGIVSLLPADRGNRVGRVWDDVEVKVGGWVRGQLTLMGLVGLISAVGYFVIGVKYWPVLALVIAIAEAIPLVGPYIGTAPALLVALTQPGSDGLPLLLNFGDFGGVTRALAVAVFAVLLQTVEGNVLVPRVMRNSVGISALTVIVSLLLGSSLAGLPGALLAVPTAGIIQVIIADLRKAAEIRAEKEQRLAAEEAEPPAGPEIILPTDEAAPSLPLILPGSPE
ncbi:MAG: AI-2E family transporter [Chloroflexia bacterium]